MEFFYILNLGSANLGKVDHKVARKNRNTTHRTRRESYQTLGTLRVPPCSIHDFSLSWLGIRTYEAKRIWTLYDYRTDTTRAWIAPDQTPPKNASAQKHPRFTYLITNTVVHMITNDHLPKSDTVTVNPRSRRNNALGPSWCTQSFQKVTMSSTKRAPWWPKCFMFFDFLFFGVEILVIIANEKGTD